MRVLVECCLQEKVFNRYYAVLAAKLCEHDKNHKFTLQVLLSIYLAIAQEDYASFPKNKRFCYLHDLRN